MQTTARSLILDLLSTLRRGSMPVRALVEAGALLELEENNMRVSLARLCASGRVERDDRGRYRLGPAVAAIGARLRGWRDLGARTRSWNGDWIAVHSARLGRGPSRRRRERAFDLLGLRELEPSLALRPDNLRGGLPAIREQLVALVTDERADACALGRVFALRGFDEVSEAAARGLWDTDALAREARDAVARLAESEDRLPALSKEAAMIESFRVGGEVLRQLMRHPLLPAEILDPAPLDELVRAMRHYDRIGRGHWSRFLARHDVPHRALPVDTQAARFGFEPLHSALDPLRSTVDPLRSASSSQPATPAPPTVEATRP